MSTQRAQCIKGLLVEHISPLSLLTISPLGNIIPNIFFFLSLYFFFGSPLVYPYSSAGSLCYVKVIYSTDESDSQSKCFPLIICCQNDTRGGGNEREEREYKMLVLIKSFSLRAHYNKSKATIGQSERRDNIYLFG